METNTMLYKRMGNERKDGGKTAVKREKFTILLIVLLLFSLLTNGLIVVIPIVKIAEAGDIITWSDSNTTLTVSVNAQEPRINWYDLQNSTGGSKLNEQIDVNQEYNFCINISSDQGWDDIEYINITAWFDNGSENTTYNNSGNLGGNLNMFLQYDNTTGTASYNMLWPDNEVTKGSLTDTVSTDPDGTGSTECHNLTFSFTPGYQFRYAPDPTDATYGFNDSLSWNFNITVTDASNYKAYEINEFGVYSYTEIASAGMPTMSGVPDENATTTSSISLSTRSNGNYSLSVYVDTLVHTENPAWTISNTTLWVRGGDLAAFTNFNGTDSIYLYGSSSTYLDAEDDNASKTTNNVDYRCSIPMGQQPGEYNATIHYLLNTKT